MWEEHALHFVFIYLLMSKVYTAIVVAPMDSTTALTGKSTWPALESKRSQQIDKKIHLKELPTTIKVFLK
jgi:hypothetical protein